MANDTGIGQHISRGFSVGPGGLQLEAHADAPTDSEVAGGRIYMDTDDNLYVRNIANDTWIDLTASGSADTLDGAYNNDTGERTVTVDAGSIVFDLNDKSNDYQMVINNTTDGTIAKALTIDAEAASSVITDAIFFLTSAGAITTALNASDAGITTSLAIGANAITGTHFGVSAVGAVTAVGVDYGAGALVGLGNIAINTAKFTVNGTSGNVLIAGDLALTGGFAVHTDKFTVAAATGNTLVGGDLTVSGSLTFGGNWTVANTLTVDELILDTDGAAPGATNCYWVRDNSGDLTGNAITAKKIHLAVAGTDEFDFGASALDMNANALDNCGYVILNAATAPANTEVYVVHDNTGDVTVNAKTGKEVHFAIAGTDEFDISGTETVMNEAGNNRDFRVESENVTSIFVTDGALDVASFGTDGIAAKFVGVSSTARTLASAAEYVGLHVAPLGAVTTQGDASTSDYISSLYVAEPNITNGGGDTITIAATVFIKDAPTEGASNYALHVAAGAVNLVGAVTMGDTLGVTGLLTASGGAAFADQKLDFTTGYIEFGTTPADAGEIRQENNVALWAARNQADDGNILGWKVNAADDYEVGADIQLADNLLYGSAAAHTADTADACLYLLSTLHATKGFVCVPNAHLGLIVGSDGSVDRATAVGDNVIHIFDGAAAPSGTLTNGVSLYSEAGECKVLDAAGNSTTLSPHTKDGDFIIRSFSMKKKSTVTIDLEKLCRALAKKYPKDFDEFIQDVPAK